MPKEPKSKDIRGIKDSTPQSTAPKGGDNYLLVIGIDKYVHCPPLENAAKDAKEIVKVLKSRFRFNAAYITELYDELATKANIYNAFRDFATKIKPTDNLVVYFSGHGEYDNVFKVGYWVPVNAEKSKVEQYIPNSDIKNILAAIKSHHTFLMVDSCFSGALFAQGADRNISLRKERDPSRWGLTAGRNEIVTDGAKGTNSPFAQSILYQLKNAAEPIGVAELWDNVLEVVSANANQTPRGEPLKVGGHQGGQFVFHLKENEIADWQQAQDSNTKNAYLSFIKQYPNGNYMAAAKAKLIALDWLDIKQMPDEKSFEIRNKIKAINIFLDKDLDAENVRTAEDLGEYLDYKEDFLRAQSNLFTLRKFARKDTPFKEAAKAKLVELETESLSENEEPTPINERSSVNTSSDNTTNVKDNKGKAVLGCLIMLIVGSLALVGINSMMNKNRTTKATKNTTEEVVPDKKPERELPPAGNAPPTRTAVPEKVPDAKLPPTSNDPPSRNFYKPLNSTIFWSGKDQLTINLDGGLPPYQMRVRKGGKVYNEGIKYPNFGHYIFNVNAQMKANQGVYNFIISDKKGNMQTIPKNISGVNKK